MENGGKCSFSLGLNGKTIQIRFLLSRGKVTWQSGRGDTGKAGWCHLWLRLGCGHVRLQAEESPAVQW